MIGESPTRPGIFQARPLVVVTPLHLALAVQRETVDGASDRRRATSQARSRVALIDTGKLALYSRRHAADFVLGGASRPSVQLLFPSGSRSDCFQISHARRDFSVRRFSSLKPHAFANSSAPWPTIMM